MVRNTQPSRHLSPTRENRPRAVASRSLFDSARLKVPVDSAKHYIDLIRAVLGFQASRATFAEHLVNRCPVHIRDHVFTDLSRGNQRSLSFLNDPINRDKHASLVRRFLVALSQNIPVISITRIGSLRLASRALHCEFAVREFERGRMP